MDLVTEHNVAPGTLYENCLLFDGGSAIINEMDLHETTEQGCSVLKFKGKFQEAESVNKNKRMYPFTILDSNVKRLEETMEAGGLVGELDHPTDSIVHFANASHKIIKLWWEDNSLMGEGVILNTPMGKVLKSLINDGVRVGISSRGVGNGKVNEEGILVIGESYKLITFDAVADPSTYAAFQTKVTTRKEGITTVKEDDALKNEADGIDKVNADLILACLGSIIKQQTREIKARLN